MTSRLSPPISMPAAVEPEMRPATARFTGRTFRQRLTRALIVPMLLVTAIAAVLAVVVLRLSALSRGATASEHAIAEVVLVDFPLPRFDGISAARAAKLCSPDVPVILISGVIGEDLAAETLTIGASDFVLKDRLDRLPGVVGRWAPQPGGSRQRR
jgi:DNA-binding NtrC family response regulator